MTGEPGVGLGEPETHLGNFNSSLTDCEARLNALDYGPEVTRIIYCEMIPLAVGAGRSEARKDDISSGPEYE